MLGTLFIVAPSGDVIIEKQYNERVPRSALEDFWANNVSGARALNEVPTVALFGRYTWTNVVHNDVMFLGVSVDDSQPMMQIEILTLIVKTFETYFKDVREDTLREYFSTVFQVLEELLDNGCPLQPELHSLEMLVPRPTIENKLRSMVESPKGKGRVVDNTVPWRAANVQHSTNEIFFDIIDFCDVIINSDGVVVRADVRGSIEVNSRLSGMPDVLLHLSNTEQFDDVAYHRCVRHTRYESDRNISFLPPDGQFTLFQYRTKPIHKFQPPFYVTPQISYNKDGGRINCMVGLRHGGLALTEAEKNIHKMTLTIPLPEATEGVNIQSCTQGVYNYNPKKKTLVWQIGHLGQSTPSLSGDITFKAGSAAGKEAAGAGEPVQVNFQIPNYSVSNVSVSSVTITGESYKPFKGVKYMTKAGRFSIRTT